MEANGKMITTENTCKKLVGFPTANGNGADCHVVHNKPLVRANQTTTLGYHLARRLVEIGIKDVFAVPGDSNLTLLDYLVAEPQLNLIGCCNELNAGYAANEYARYNGVNACVVTFTVGGLSILNAIAGAYSEDLPIICIVGGSNSNDYGTNNILHHTIGIPADFNQELCCFQPVTCHQALVKNLHDAHEQIDTAIATALRESKPVYISLACNLSAIPHHSFIQHPVPFYLTPKWTNKMCLDIAVELTSEFLNKAVKPVMVGGPRLRMAKACDAFMEMVDASGYPLAVLASAKGIVAECNAPTACPGLVDYPHKPTQDFPVCFVLTHTLSEKLPRMSPIP